MYYNCQKNVIYLLILLSPSEPHMGAKSRLLFLLVASLIGIGFALMPATTAEENYQINEITHNDAKVENSITISVQNDLDKEILYSLSINVFSEDLQEEIELESSNLVFSIDGLQTYNTNFSFTIPRSGNYLFNITLLSNNDGVITSSSIEQEHLFYDNLESNLEESIIDYYLDENDNANWILNGETEQIELINLENSYSTGIILGPYDTNGNKNNILLINNLFEISDTAEYSIAYTKNFNQTQLYSTIWTDIYHIDNESPNQISLNLEDDSNIYLRLLATDTIATETNFWNIDSIIHKYISIKHNLEITSNEHYFFDIEQTTEILVNIENTGIFDQQLGNITISVDVYSQSDKLETLLRTPNLISGEIQTIDFRINNLEAGNYYCIVNVILVEENIFSTEKIILMSISTTNLASEMLTNSDHERINLLVEIDDINDFNIEENYVATNLVRNYYLIEISNNNGVVLDETNYRLICAISMDENRFEITPSENSIETIEGILAPSIVFSNYNTYSANIMLSNEGFYSDEYQISYFFASTFIESLSGPNTINVEPGNIENIELSLIPLPKVPREGGSQLQIKISNQYETKSVTYVLSYAETKIEITEQKCNKHSILLGQDIICTNTISNQGYNSNQLSINIIVSNEKGITEIIDQINIEELKNEESLVIRTTYFPKIEENFKLYVDVYSAGFLLVSSEMEENINVVAAGSEENAETTTFEAPKIKLTQTFFAISFAGIAFQFRRSENFRYLTFKFFIPMYSRLQKDTIADEPTRQKLLNTIYTEPGTNFTQLKERLGLHNGTLAHHINILENNKMVTSHRSGRQRLFFPFGGSINSTIRNSLITNRTQKDIISIVKENPGITQSMISQQLSMSRQKINYHVNSLSNNSLLRIEKQGRITRLYPMHFT